MEVVPDYTHSVVEELKTLTESGRLTPDRAQLGVAAKLDRVLGDLRDRRPAKKKSALGWLFAKSGGRPEPVRGLYIHGSVGRGKTMLMEMFFKKAATDKKRRAHFHEFMADVHARVHDHRMKLKNGETREADPIAPVAAAIFAEAELLCFDEFSVTDITDAMILSRLFNELFALGCTLVATSNVEPGDLYRDGLNRGLFLPFIEILQRHVETVTLDSPTDYRMEKLANLPVYITPLGPQADAAMEATWHQVTDGHRAEPAEVPRKGRVIRVPAATGRVARFGFADLCERPLAAADYLAIAERYDSILVERVPKLGPEKRNETKRFINLVDTFYDNAVRLYISAAAPPEDLLAERRGTEGFEFDRTVSRLFEMQSQDYAALHRQRHAS
ncbi:cell division protein ZapE [Pseudorhizobium tarimense]|uniref:Cell division protein ZapE n=1 Tax=Pseudorhizobium tarimense TaxID=1079109 RepID=A0ABV2H9D1_9HYPH|nr:cell division protein ZapE [Pseudorhizobium tarimense]MCJ8520206.1 cell division protein ZapE [Pseudorhizobium tarimense]